MITFQNEGGWFNYRVVAVVREGDRVLLHRSETDDFWSMPGGRCELGEPARDALRREMNEELGVEIRVVRLLWVVENFFRIREQNFHELALYFLVSLPEHCPEVRDRQAFAGSEPGLRLLFRWFPLQALPSVELLPTFLKEGLLALPGTPEHVVHTDSPR